jgi:hypothetical protein
MGLGVSWKMRALGAVGVCISQGRSEETAIVESGDDEL